jgi:hypothetical protein
VWFRLWLGRSGARAGRTSSRSRPSGSICYLRTGARVSASIPNHLRQLSSPLLRPIATSCGSHPSLLHYPLPSPGPLIRSRESGATSRELGIRNQDSRVGPSLTPPCPLQFANQSVATSSSVPLTYTTSSNTSIIRVDNTSTVAYNDKRNTIKILSTDYYAVGSVWVLDAKHVPYGCSVWPAFWSYGTGTWPEGGEIDTLEGVNNQVSSQMALHTEDG